MIANHIVKSRTNRLGPNRASILNELILSRNLVNVQTIEYDLITATSSDLDPTGNFLAIGLSNGAIDLHGIKDFNFGNLERIYRYNVSDLNVHRVQWNPSDEQLLCVLDNQCLYLLDPAEMQVISKNSFSLTTNWAEWNPGDISVIAVCGSESQTRLMDIRTGSSAQTIILAAPSGLATHRPTRCIWSRQDTYCLVVGDNEGFIHIYDTRNTVRAKLLAGDPCGQISGLAFTKDNSSIITSQGTENHLVEWSFEKGTLQPSADKFKRIPKSVDVVENVDDTSSVAQTSSGSSSKRSKKSHQEPRKKKRRPAYYQPLPVDAYLRCQFYVTDHQVYCPVPASVKKSKEIYVYDIKSGIRLKTIKSDDILSQGVYTVTGLLPDSMVLYVGGRGRMRVWSIDEDHQRKMEEKIKQYHRSKWDSDED